MINNLNRSAFMGYLGADAKQANSTAPVTFSIAVLPSSLIGFLAELALGSYVDLPQPEDRDVLKEALDLFKAPKPIPTIAKPANKKTAK